MRRRFNRAVRLPKPRSFPPLQVARHRRLLRENALGPLARLARPALCGEERRVVQVGFRRRGHLGRLLKERVCFLGAAHVGVGVRQQCEGAVGVVFRLTRRHVLEVGGRRGEVVQVNGRNATPVDRVLVSGARRDRLVVALACAGKLLFLEVQISQLLVVARRRVLEDHGLELTDALAPAECVVHVAEQAEIRNDLDEDVDQRAGRAEEKDDVHPDRLRTTPQEVDHGERLQQDAPRVHERQETHA